MKRTILICLSVLLVLTFASCKKECVHEWGEPTVDPATCTETGESKSACALCGETKTEEIPVIEHAYGEWTVEKEATCTETGESKSNCALCGETKTEEIPVIEHTAVIDPAIEATCAEGGMSEGSHCEVCGTVIVAAEATPIADHKYEGGKCAYCGKIDENATVIDAVNLTSRPAFSDFYIDMFGEDWANDYPDNKVAYPMLNSTHPNAVAFNKKLSDAYGRYADSIAEEDNIVKVAYDYEIYNGIVGIVVNPRMIPMGAGGYEPAYHFYYYDLNNNRELSFNEYLTALGLTYEGMTDKLNNNSEFVARFLAETYIEEFVPLSVNGQNYYVLNVICGKERTIIYHTLIDSYYSATLYDTAGILE